MGRNGGMGGQINGRKGRSMKEFDDFMGPDTGGYDPELYDWMPTP